jgi:signal transduction histidine kinase
VIAEFRALRASVVRLWERAQYEGREHADPAGVTRFHEAIDEALGRSVGRSMQAQTRYRDLFLGILGHDLRNPLGAIRLGAVALAQIELSPKEVRDLAARILRSADVMTKMVEDLLDLTRTRFGKTLPIEPQPLDAGEVCRRAIDEVLAAHPGCRIRYSASGDLHGEWDEIRLTQLTTNLVVNACQHGMPSGVVTVEVEGRGDLVTLTVHNLGPAISKNDLPLLFDPLRHAGKEAAPKPGGGLGLGLYIVRQIAASHGGTAEVTSEKGQGTTFTVKLPRARR